MEPEGLISLRSQLYSLEPVGLGTPYAESLTSYICQLARAYGVPVRELLRHQVLPHFRPKLVRFAALASWSNNLRGLLGPTTWGADMVAALQALTGRSDLKCLTLLPWHGVLYSRSGLVRPRRAWCPACYAEWQASSAVVRDPLLWSLSAVEVCPVHHCRLQQVCPKRGCLKRQPYLPPSAELERCATCHEWLGDGPCVPVGANGWEAWVAGELGALIAAGPSLKGHPGQDQIRMVLGQAVETMADHNRAELARQLSVPKSSITYWLNNHGTPDIQAVLRLAYLLNTNLVHVVTATVPNRLASEPPRRGHPPPARFRKYKIARRDTRTLESMLEQCANGVARPMSLTEVSAVVDCDRSYLRSKFPALCRVIARNHQARLAAERQDRAVTMQSRVRQAVLKLAADGRYPSRRRVAMLVTGKYFFQTREDEAIWRRVLHELDPDSIRRGHESHLPWSAQTARKALG